MAHSVGSSAVVKLVDSVSSNRQVRVRNDGSAAVLISKDPAMTASGASAFSVASGSEETVDLASGESLFAITASGSASVEVI